MEPLDPSRHQEGKAVATISRSRRSSTTMSACGVLCADCPAYLAASKGIASQRRVAEAWHRIDGLNETPERISCGGCFGPDEQMFHTGRGCKARHCAHRHDFVSCAECVRPGCPLLEKAQAVWDHVSELSAVLSHSDFVRYVQPYCGHRRRLLLARATHGHH